MPIGPLLPRSWPLVAALPLRGLRTVASASASAADARLPDHDCVRGGGDVPGVVRWADWLAALEEPGDGGLLDKSTGFTEPLLMDARLRDVAAEECPAGLLMADLLHTLVCLERAGTGGLVGSCYGGHEAHARAGLRRLGLRVLLGLRWPIYDALQFFSFSSRAAASAAEAKALGLDCGHIQEPILDWQAFKRVFAGPDWYQPAVDIAYGPDLAKRWRDAPKECPLGFAMANFIKAMLCAHTESICFAGHAKMIAETLEEIPLHLVAGSGWPIFWLQAHLARAVRRHGFRLDFWPHELLGGGGGDAGGSAAPAPSEAMRDLRALLPDLQRAAAEGGGGDGNALQLVYATMAHGPRFSPYVGRFVRRARALGIADVLVVFCLDAEAFQECQVAEGSCVRGTPSILNKFTLPLVLLREGLDVMWLDLDVFLFQAPTPFVRQQQRDGDFEMLISGAFAVDCVCSGVVFFRAAPRTRLWLEHLLVWMYEHPYEHDQKAVSAFLRAGERVAFDSELPVTREDTPKWAFLDPETQFVSARHVDAAGWTGDPDHIVAFHLLHGDSDGAEASRQFAARNSLGVGYLPLLDLFFNQTGLPELYSTPVLPHHVSEELKAALFRSRWPGPRPATPGRCNETVPMNF